MSEPTPGQEPRPERNEPDRGEDAGQQPHQVGGSLPPGSDGRYAPPGGGYAPAGGGPPHPHGPLHAPPPPKRRKWPWIVLVSGLVFLGAIAGIATAVRNDTTKSVTVRYSVTGTARDVIVAYPTWRQQTIFTHKVTVNTLPWHKELTTNEFVKGGTLTITLGAGGGTATCSVVVGNGTSHTATATGPHATATCKGF